MSSGKRSANKPVERFQAPKGTNDVFPPASKRWENMVVAFVQVVERAGYGLIQGPMFEDLGVFRRMGEGTDVVGKEMYDFLDTGDPPQHLARRPEGTASVARAFVEHRTALAP
ncbi:MAG: ATP phosphoribosyltransferase regulatory subunit [Actinobacteria bacterium]|nr:ATP phosphoribosyltransferase regulatory subunit [Actinomycetota bacterium]